MKQIKKQQKYYLHILDTCNRCGYSSGYYNTQSKQDKTHYPNHFDKVFKSLAELKRYCNENKIDLE